MHKFAFVYFSRPFAAPLVCLWAATFCAFADAETVTLDRAIELAELTHPRLRAGATRPMAAAGRLLAARAYPNPEAAFLTGRQVSQPPGGRVYNVPVYTFSQPLEFGQLRPARTQLATRGLESSQYYYSELRLAVLSNVRRTFFNALRYDREIAIADESLRLAQDLRDRIRIRVEVGEVGRLELIRAEAEVATARTFAANARIQRLTAIAAFRAAVGTDASRNLEPAPVDNLAPPIGLPDLDELRRQVIERHPALSFAQSEVRRAEARVNYEKALKRPQPELRFEADMTNPSYRAGIAITLPAWNRRTGEIAVAEADAAEARYLSGVRRLELLAALESAYRRFEISGQEVNALEIGLMREAQEAVRAAETAYQLGERSILDVLDAQRVLRSVRINLLNAQFNRQAAIIEIDELRANVVPGVTP